MTRQELDEYCGSIDKVSDDMTLEEYLLKIEKKKKEYYNDTIQRPESRRNRVQNTEREAERTCIAII